jgi:RimJ/RimL family protein N-acetyltransferase
MIRNHQSQDIESIIQLMNLQWSLSELDNQQKREELNKDSNIRIYSEDDTVLGMWTHTTWDHPFWGKAAHLTISVRKDALNFENIVDVLYQEAQAKLSEESVQFIMAGYDETSPFYSTFYSEKGYTPWYGYSSLIYTGQRQPDNHLTMRLYREEDFTDYYESLGECFTPMRQAMDIPPYNVFSDRREERIEKLKEEMNKNKENIFMFFDGDVWVGSSLISQEDIDDLFVVPSMMNKGYGKLILQSTVNLCLDRKLENIYLGVVHWNVKAQNLYLKTGFKTIKSIKYMRRFISE